MPLYLVTGLPGSGKSTVCAELQLRGYEAYDGDEDKLAKWYDSNGIEVPDPSVNRGERDIEFIHTHTRDIARSLVEKLTLEAQGKPVFLCNDPQNETELLDLFSKVFALFTDEQTIRRRLMTRTGNAWGKAPHELEFVLGSQQKAHTDCKKFGYIAINSAQPVETIVDYILEQVSDKK